MTDTLVYSDAGQTLPLWRLVKIEHSQSDVSEYREVKMKRLRRTRSDER